MNPRFRCQPWLLPLLALLALGVLLAGCEPLITVQFVAAPGAGAIVSPAMAALPTTAPTGRVHPTPVLAPRRAPVNSPLASTPTVPAPAGGPPTRIVAPAIELDAQVIEVQWVLRPDGSGTDWQIAADAAGFHFGSAYPGHRGNTVISGHHNILGKVFARLHELVPGDAIDLYVHDRAYRYVVEDAFILPERGVPEEQRLQNARWIGPTDDDRLTLVTCWPATDNSHRLIVIAHPAEEETYASVR